MRVLVCGGRDFNDDILLRKELGKLENVTLIIQGGATGADTLASRWAAWREIPAKEFKADWKAYGPAAGPIRNALMLEEGKPDLVVAFRGGKGTANMVKLARLAVVEVKEIK